MYRDNDRDSALSELLKRVEKLNRDIEELKVSEIGAGGGGGGGSSTADKIQETGDPKILDIGAIPDGKFMKRSGSYVIGDDIPPASQIKESGDNKVLNVGNVPDNKYLKRSGLGVIGDDVISVRESGNQILSLGSIPDGKYVKRSGTSLIATDVTDIKESGNQVLSIGGISDGKYLKRSGNDIVGSGLDPSEQIKETSGPTTLDIKGIADGKFLKRSGGDIVGDDAPPAVKIKESGSQELPIGSIADGKYLKRSGTNVIGDDVTALKEGGGQVLAIGSVADGKVFGRSGNNIVGIDIGGGGPTTQIEESGGPTVLDIASIIDGEFLQRDGANIVGNDLLSYIAGEVSPVKIVAVKSAVFTGTQAVSVNANSEVNITNLSIIHSVAKSTNKLLLIAQVGEFANSVGGAQGGVGIAVDNVMILRGNSDAGRARVGAGGNPNNTNETWISIPIHLSVLYSPNSTASKTYTVRMKQFQHSTGNSSVLYVNRSQRDYSSVDRRAASSLILLEVAE